jgi:hypothetical protein
MLVQFPVAARTSPWRPLIQNYLEFLYEGKKRGKNETLREFFYHESIPLINYGYVIYRGASMVTITITVLVANTYISTYILQGSISGLTSYNSELPIFAPLPNVNGFRAILM